jgi:hypothetical protein
MGATDNGGVNPPLREPAVTTPGTLTRNGQPAVVRGRRPVVEAAEVTPHPAAHGRHPLPSRGPEFTPHPAHLRAAPLVNLADGPRRRFPAGSKSERHFAKFFPTGRKKGENSVDKTGGLGIRLVGEGWARNAAPPPGRRGRGRRPRPMRKKPNKSSNAGGGSMVAAEGEEWRWERVRKKDVNN